MSNANPGGLSQPTNVEKRRITKAHGVHKVGDIITVTRWATFGCYDEKGNWVDFYYSEKVD